MRCIVLFGLFLASVCSGSSARAAVIETIDFEDVIVPFPVLQVPSGVYTSQFFTIQSFNGTPMFVDPAVAGSMTGSNSKFFAWNALTGPGDLVITRTLGGTFNLDRLVLGTLNGGALGTASYSITSTHPPISGLAPGGDFFTPSLTNVTSVAIHWLAGNSLAIDNIVLSDSVAPAAVPEPASAVVLCFGSLALVVRRMRRRNPVVA